MNNHGATVLSVIQTSPAWIGLAVGHFVDSITLSNIALAASIMYSVVNIYMALRRRK